MMLPVKKYHLELTLDQLQIVAAGLNELPRKHSQPIIETMQVQMTEQDELIAAEAKREAAKAEGRLKEPEELEVEKPKLELVKGPEDPSQ